MKTFSRTFWWQWALAFWLALLAIIALPSTIEAQQPLTGGRVTSRDGKWLLPVSGGVLSSDENDHLARGSVHAWDLSAPQGTPVYPMASGTVEYAGCNNAGGYGCWAMILHDNGYASVYGHMQDEGNQQILVRTGEQVTAWSPIGRVGWTGRTSFGPHVHWEVRQADVGQMRLDRYFVRSKLSYCKFCAVEGNGLTGLTADLSSYANSRVWGLIPYALGALIILGLGGLLLTRPEKVMQGVQLAAIFTIRVLGIGRNSFRRARRWRHRYLFGFTTVFILHSFLCGATPAVAVWMAKEEISPQALWAYLRWGLYPFPGLGYHSGGQYSAVWGMPCQHVGTLGQVCTPTEVVDKGLQWQRAVGGQSLLGSVTTTPVVIPRLNGHFGYKEMRRLLNEMHYVKGLVIADTGGDLQAAHDAIDELTTFGLDGVAVDMEFVPNLQRKDIRELADHLARSRASAGLKGDGVLVLWNVFHNLKGDKNSTSKEQALAPAGVKIVPIFDGYGSAESKIAGLAKTQQLFDVTPKNSGLMAFDNRWPVNSQCSGFGNQRGYDCQNWQTLFTKAEARAVGWWVQQ